MQTDLENKKKEIAALENLAKNKEKAQRKLDRERAKLSEKERERNLIEERLNSTKLLDDLKEQESELKRQNEEDRAIAQDENTSPIHANNSFPAMYVDGLPALIAFELFMHIITIIAILAPMNRTNGS